MYLKNILLALNRIWLYQESMAQYFVPISGCHQTSLDQQSSLEIAPLQIKGHRVVILAHDPYVFEDAMSLFKAEGIGALETGESAEDEESLLGTLAQQVNGGVVVAPDDIDLDDLIAQLQEELPWLH